MNKRYRLASLGLFALMSLIITQVMHAAGTPAGTVITSQASANYTTKNSGASLTAFSNSVSVTVQQMAAVNITPSSLAQTTNGDGVNADYAIQITNSGNGSDSFGLSASSTKGFSSTFYHDINGNGTLDAADEAAGAITSTGTLAADAVFHVIARVAVPATPSLNGQADVTTVTGTSAFNAAKTATFTGTTTIHTAYFNVSSSLSVLPAAPLAGGDVTYTFTLTNSGSLAATNVTFSDLVHSPYTYVSGTGTGFAAPGGDGTAHWTIGSIDPGASVTVTLTLHVPAGTANGTALHNTISVDYTGPGSVPHTVVSNEPFAAVGATSSVLISLTSYAYTVEMEDGITIPLTVTNTGNITSVFEMSANSGHGYTWTFYNDVNNNGTYESGTDTPLTNTNAAAGVDVGTLAPAASIKLVARVTIPVGVATDQMVDNSTLTVTSADNPLVFQSSTVALTVNIPSITLVRSVTPATTREPGQTSTYTTTYRNVGNGKAYNVVVVDGEPDNCTYVANSTVLNGAAKTDAADGDEVTVTTGGNGKKVITVTLGTLNGLAPATPGVIKFDCVVN